MCPITIVISLNLSPIFGIEGNVGKWNWAYVIITEFIKDIHRNLCVICCNIKNEVEIL